MRIFFLLSVQWENERKRLARDLGKVIFNLFFIENILNFFAVQQNSFEAKYRSRNHAPPDAYISRITNLSVDVITPVKRGL